MDPVIPVIGRNGATHHHRCCVPLACGNGDTVCVGVVDREIPAHVPATCDEDPDRTLGGLRDGDEGSEVEMLDAYSASRSTSS